MASSTLQFSRHLTTLNLSKFVKPNKQPVIYANDIDPKSYDDIPTKQGLLPSSLGLILSGGPGFLHEHCDKRHKELGPIYREYLGHMELVFLADTRMIQTVLANEGKCPRHNVPEAWIYFNEVKKIDRGLFFQVGEPWSKLRKALNKVLLTDVSNMARFSGDILSITSDLMKSWLDNNRNVTQEEFIVENIKTELDKWSIESTGFMLFGDRMGCIPSDKSAIPDHRAGELVKYVSKMFAETSKFQIIPPKIAYKLNLSTWKKFDDASTNMIKIASDYANFYISEIRKNKHAPDSMLNDMIKQDTLTDDEISRSLVDLIIAAADTTSNSLQWMLYSIAKHRDVQMKILNEIDPIMKNPDEQAINLLYNAPYLRAFVKESMRLYPTAPFLARSLEKDIVLAGYQVPAGTPLVFSLFTTSRSSRYFDRPYEFRPERWMRPSNNGNTRVKSSENHAYASLPFGLGARNCIGRRLAEFEIFLFLASFVQYFESSTNDDIKIKLKMILSPDRPINIKLKPR